MLLFLMNVFAFKFVLETGLGLCWWRARGGLQLGNWLDLFPYCADGFNGSQVLYTITECCDWFALHHRWNLTETHLLRRSWPDCEPEFEWQLLHLRREQTKVSPGVFLITPTVSIKKSAVSVRHWGFCCAAVDFCFLVKHELMNITLMLKLSVPQWLSEDSQIRYLSSVCVECCGGLDITLRSDMCTQASSHPAQCRQ